jgi:hypothetical protein
MLDETDMKNHRTLIAMEDSTHRTVSFDADPGYKAGDKVKVSGNSMTRQ